MEPIIVTMIALSSVIGFGLCWALTSLVRLRWGIALVVVLVLVAVVLLLAGRGAQAWDGLGFVILALFIALPAALGAALGAALAGWMQRRAQQR